MSPLLKTLFIFKRCCGGYVFDSGFTSRSFSEFFRAKIRFFAPCLLLWLANQSVFALTVTTTNFSSSAASAAAGQTVILTARVSPAAATGTVTFKDGTSTLGTGTLSSGAATFSKAFIGLGTHNLTAIYAGDSQYATSTSSAFTQNVYALAATSTSLKTSQNPTNIGQSVLLTATVTGTDLTGSVTFKDGTSTLGSATLSSGVATFAKTFAGGGNHSLTAVYSGDSTNASSTSPVCNESVSTKTSTSVALSLTSSSIPAGDITFYTVSVTPSGATGNITLMDGTTAVQSYVSTTYTNGTSSQITFKTPGVHALTAVYDGNSQYLTSSSPTVNENVTTASTTTVLGVSPIPVVVGKVLSLSAAVTATSLAGTPTGTVNFSDGTTSLGNATLNAGVATFQTKLNIAGIHGLTATYNGDATYSGGISSGVDSTVNQSNTATTVSSSTNPVMLQQPATFSATVSGFNPTGTVNFFDGAAPLGSSTAASGVATLSRSFSTGGSHSITAVYLGDPSNLPSTSATLSETAKVGTTSTTVALASSPATVALNQTVSLSASVTPASASGLVTFADGTTPIGASTLTAGRATLDIKFALGGTHALRATYNGDATFSVSSASASEVVSAGTSSTALLSSVNPTRTGQSTTLTATVAGSVPGGSVTFYDGTSSLGTVNLVEGAARLNASFSSSGSHVLKATYAGDPSNLGNTSSTVTQTVNAASTPSTVSLSGPSTAMAGTGATLTATVNPTSATGTVTFMDGTTVLGSVPVSAGSATFSANFATAGTRSFVTAAFSGSSTYAGSVSAPYGLTVYKAYSGITLESSINPAAVAQNTNLKATVTGSYPTGIVTFRDGYNGGVVIGTANLVGGAATLPMALLGGVHYLTTSYAGDANNSSTVDGSLIQTVPANATSLIVTPSVDPVPVGQKTILTVTVTGKSAAAPPTGSVTIRGIGTVNIIAGTGTIVTNFFDVGAHEVFAQYAGDPSNLPSASNTLIEAVPPGAIATVTAAIINPSNAAVGQPVALSAKVTPAGVTGGVTFYDGAVVLGTAPISAGAALLSSAFATSGAHTITAVYVGDGAFAASTSATATATITPASTAISVGLPPSTPTAGQSTTLTATVTSTGASYGVVTFMDGATSLGTAYVYYVTPTTSLATFSGAFPTAGNHTVTAVYAGNANSLSSTSPALIQAVNVASTSIVLASSVNPANVGQSLNLTAAVSGVNPTGMVTFKDGATVLGTGTISGGLATYSTTFSSSGTHAVTASYGGDLNNAVSSSSSLSQAVSGSPPALALAVSGTTVSAGQGVLSFKATATGAYVIADTVHFYDGATDVGSAIIDSAGIASASLAGWTVGSHSVTAKLVDARYPGIASSAVNISATANSPSIVLSTDQNPVNFPTSGSVYISLSAKVSGMYVAPYSSVTITLRDNGVVIETENFYNYDTPLYDTFPVGFRPTFSASGLHNLTATIAADTWNVTSKSPTLAETVGGVTSFDLAASTPAVVGRSTKLTASINGGSTTTPPSGSVTFKDGSDVIAVASVVSRVASAAFIPSTSGTHFLSATYAGDGTFANLPSSATNALDVFSLTSAVSLSSDVTTVAAAAPVVLTAVLNVAGATGNVTFSDDVSTLGTVPVSSAKATLRTSLNAVGPHRIVATYSGDATTAPDVSNFINVQVGTSGTPASPGVMTWLYGYDAVGSLITAIDPNANATQKYYDNLDRNIKLVQPLPATGGTTPIIQFGYDGQDDLTSVKDPRSLTTSYTVNGLGTTTAIASPDTGPTGATYDASGKLLTRTDAAGNKATFVYDSINRVRSISYSTGTPTLFEYDGGAAAVATSTGKLSKVTDESGSTAYTYDGFGHVSTKTSTITTAAGTKSFTVRYTWGATGPSTGKLVALQYPSGTVANYIYDATEHLNSVTVNPVNANGVGASSTTVSILSAMTYNGNNAIGGWKWSDGTAYQRGYDTFGRLQSYPLGVSTGSGTAAGLLRTLGYDNAGRIKGYTHTRSGTAQPSFDQSFNYDGLDRLLQDTMASAIYAYAYDQTGNRTTRVVGGKTYTNGIAPASNQLTTVQTAGTGGSIVTNTYKFDPAGNLLNDGVATYTYSARSRMSSATLSAGTVSYLYNGLDQRVSKTGPTALVAGGGAYFAYDDAGRLLGEYDANLNPVYETVYVGSTPVAVLKQTGVAASSTLATAAYNVWADQIDTPRVVTRKADQAIVWRWDAAEAFGATAPDQNPNALGLFAFNQRFPGQVADQETGLLQNGYRYYDSATGRYRSFDPIGLRGGINGYAYVGGNAVAYTDPEGLETMLCARELGGPNESTTAPSGSLLRHDYLVVDGKVYSFQPSESMVWSQGRIAHNESTTNDKCESVSKDPNFDRAVEKAISEVGDPKYNIWAYPGTITYAAGARNCQSWSSEVLRKAGKK